MSTQRPELSKRVLVVMIRPQGAPMRLTGGGEVSTIQIALHLRGIGVDVYTLEGSPSGLLDHSRILKSYMLYYKRGMLKDTIEVIRMVGKSKCDSFYEFLDSEIKTHSLPVVLNRIGSAFTIFFTQEPVTDFHSAKRADASRYAQYFHALLKAGIYMAPSQFEANFISAAHSQTDLSRAAEVISKTLLQSH